MLGLGQHTSLGYVVGLGNTLYWVMLLVYVGPLFMLVYARFRKTRFLCIIVDLKWGPQQWTFNNLNYNSRKAFFRISAETAEAILPQSDNLIFQLKIKTSALFP
jgi:hypothetical protein